MRLMALYHTSDPSLCIIPVQEYYHQDNIVHPNTRVWARVRVMDMDRVWVRIRVKV